MKTHVINRWFQKLLSALVLIGLLAYGNVQAQINVQDGGDTIIRTNPVFAGPWIIGTNFTVTAGADVLVVELFSRDNSHTNGDPFLGNVMYGSTMLTQGVATNNAASSYAWSDIYYLFNPTPGTQTVTATDTAGSITGGGGLSTAMDMAVFTLNGASTSVTPIPFQTNNSSALSFSFTISNTPISAFAAATASFGTGGQAGETFGFTCSSGIVSNSYTANVIEETMGYVFNLNPGANTLSCAPGGYTATPNKFGFVALLFTPSHFTPPPTNVVAASQLNSIKLTWGDAAGGTSTNFVISRSTTSGGPYTTTFNSATTSFTDSTVFNYVTYYYIVQAEGPYGESVDSPEVSTMSFGPEPPPTGLIAQPLNGQVGLIWNPLPGASSYNVLSSTSSLGPYSVIASPTVAIYTNTALANGTTYYYEVNAVDPYGTGTVSSAVSATPGIPNAGIYLHDGGIFSTQTLFNAVLFPVVTNVTITMPFAVSPGANTMVAELLDHNYDDTDNESPSFMIWSNATLGTTQLLTRAVSQNEMQYSYEDCDLYYLWNPSPGVGTLSCTDTCTNGGYVTDAMLLQAYTLSGVNTNVAPQPASAGANTATALQGAVSLSTNWGWAAAMSVNYAGGSGNIDTNTATSGTSFCYNFGFNGNQNCLGWIANMLAGPSTITATYSLAEHSALAVEAFVPQPGIRHPAPINPVATLQDDQIGLSWTDDSGGAATNYVIYRTTTLGSGYGAIATNNGHAATSFTDTAVTPWTNFYYEVTATGPNATSLPSSPDVGGSPAGLPGPVSGMTATNGIYSVLLNWTGLGATNFNVLCATNTPTVFGQVANVNGNAYTFAGKEATLYYFEVQPVNFYGSGSTGTYSSVVSAIPCVVFFTNWVSIPVDTTCINGWVSSPGLADGQYASGTPGIPPAPSDGYLVLDGYFGPGTTNDLNGLTTNLSVNLNTYTEMQVDIQPYAFDEPDVEIQAIEFSLDCNGTSFQLYNAAGTAANNFNAMTNGQISLPSSAYGFNAHYSCPMNSLTNADTALVTSLQIAILDSLNTAGGSNEEDVGFANIEFDGAPGYLPQYMNLNNPTIAHGAASAVISGTLGFTTGAGPVYAAQGTPIMVTVQGLTTQATTVSDATGDFSINYTGTAGLALGPYGITFANPSDMVSFVAGTNTNAGTLTVAVIGPVGPFSIPSPRLNAAGTSLLVTPGGNTAAGHTYYLLQTTNLNPPVVWTTNTSFAGTGAPVTNSVPLNSAKDIFLEYQVN